MKKLITNSKYEFRTNYYADDNGHIWSEYKQDYLTEYPDKDGYMKVVLMTKDKPAGKGHRFSVHRLVLHTFNPIENENYYQVDHIDGNKTNNTLQNLKWVSCLENLNNPNTKPNRRVYDQDGTHNAMSKFTEESLMNMIQDINSGNYTQNEIILKYNTSREAIRRIIHKQTYISELKDIKINPNFKSDYCRDTKGEKNGRAKLNNEKVLEIIKLIQSKKYSLVEIAKIYNVAPTSISAIKNKKTWKHLTKNITFN